MNNPYPHTNRLVLIAFTWLAAGHGSWLAAAAQDFTEEVHKTFPLAAKGKLSLDNVNGSIQISSWDKAEVQVDAVKHAKSEEYLNDITIDFRANDDAVSIKTRLPNSSGRRGDSGHVDYDIKVPRQVRLDKIVTVNGKIEVDGAEGLIRLVTVNGSLNATKLSGSGSFNSVNGSIDVEFTKLDSDQGINLETVNGKAVLAVPANANAQVKANTVNGRISTDFDLSPTKHFPVGSTLEGQLGDGGPSLKMSSVNGALHLKKTE